MIHLNLWEDLSKQQSFELSVKSVRVGRLRKLAGSEVQTDGVMKLKELSPADFKQHLGIFKSFSFEDRRVRDV